MKHEDDYAHFLNKNPHPRFLKSLEVIQGFSSIYVNDRGKKIINFSSSDYLGLANHPLLIQRSHEYAKRYGVGASASRLVSGNFDCYNDIETALATALGKPAALILGSGYQANQSVLEALLHPKIFKNDPLVFCDRLCHASMMAGVSSIKRLHRFRHNDLTHLHDLLKKYGRPDHPIFILAESVYSMEGDRADLLGLINLAKQFEAFLYIDDAHSIGVYGQNGWGYAREVADDIPVIMGTFSKALGSFGGFIGCSLTLKNYLINKCRGLIYSTGLSPAVLGAIRAAIELVPEMDNARIKLQKRADAIRAFFQAENLDYGTSSTHLIPWITKDAKKTLYVSELLRQEGILATGIQPPSVPLGQSRIRFSLSALHSDEDIAHFYQAVSRVRKKLPA